MSKKLSICHVITRMVIGGAQENTLYTIQGHLEKGHQVTLITGCSTGPEGNLLKNSCPPGMELLEIPDLVREIKPWRDWRAYCQLKKIFQAKRFSVVHTHASKAGILGRLAATKAGIPLVVHTVHGQAFHPYQAKWKNWMYILAEKFAAKHCHKIYAVAQAMIEQCVKAGVAPREKYKVVYSGMDLQAFLTARPEAALREKLRLPAGTPVIGKIARIFELKGYECLVDAAVQIIAAIPSVRFLLVGDGILRPAIEERIAELGISEHFIFTGLVPPQDICRYTALMDVLAHLSLREGLPRTAVQALASGIPVVAYPLDGTPEVVRDGETGYLCEPENTSQVAERLIGLLQNPTLRQQFGTAGRALVSGLFAWQRMADILEEEYYQELQKQQNIISDK